jgi:hypothetical protein
MVGPVSKRIVDQEGIKLPLDLQNLLPLIQVTPKSEILTLYHLLCIMTET